MKKFGSVLLSIVFAIALLCTALLGIVRSKVNGGSIAALISDVLFGKEVAAVQYPDNGLYYPDAGKQVILSAYGADDFGDFSDFDSLDIGAMIQEYAAASGIDISEEMVTEIINSPEAVDFLSKYSAEVVDYITGTTTEFNIDPEDVKVVVNSSIAIYEKATGEKVDTTGLDELIDEGIAEAGTVIAQGLDEAKEEMGTDLEYLKTANELLSLKTLLILIGVCVILAVLIFVINMSLGAMFKYISIPGMVDGVLLFGSGLFLKSGIPVIIEEMNKEIPAKLTNAIMNFVRSLLDNFIGTGLIIFGAGVILITVGICLSKKQTKEVAAE